MENQQVYTSSPRNWRRYVLPAERTPLGYKPWALVLEIPDESTSDLVLLLLALGWRKVMDGLDEHACTSYEWHSHTLVTLDEVTTTWPDISYRELLYLMLSK